MHPWVINSWLTNCKFAWNRVVVAHFVGRNFIDIFVKTVKSKNLLLTFVLYTDGFYTSVTALVLIHSLKVIFSGLFIHWDRGCFFLFWDQFLDILFDVEQLIFHVLVKGFTVAVGTYVVPKLIAGVAVFDVLEGLLERNWLIYIEEEVIVGGVFPFDFVRGEQRFLLGFEVYGMGLLVGR